MDQYQLNTTTAKHRDLSDKRGAQPGITQHAPTQLDHCSRHTSETRFNAGTLGQSKSEVRVLQRLTGCAFEQVIERGDYHCLSRLLVDQ
jgi:hypothetical protein